MKNSHANHYKQAFESWLVDNRIKHISPDKDKKLAFGNLNIKSFDYLLYPRSGQTIIAAVRGRKFKAESFEKLAGLQCWLATNDISQLKQWQQVLGQTHKAVFVFAYRIENFDVDFDGREIYDFNNGKYIFFCIDLERYCEFMKIRSPKWQTVTISADDFRLCAVQAEELLL
ncbi:MAG: HYExAFE family protein [Planctomycetes bacterium]|nr:HYExAFE family protein [Planctomycetota bacterium]MCK5472720.1 HYExAFE family protein [Planctomycetota bacterium]